MVLPLLYRRMCQLVFTRGGVTRSSEEVLENSPTLLGAQEISFREFSKQSIIETHRNYKLLVYSLCNDVTIVLIVIGGWS